jgi:hypothetical protein
MIRSSDSDNPTKMSHMTVFLIDLALAKLFREPATYLHIPHSRCQSIVGTLPFTSINAQKWHTQSRRDDLESLAYTIIFLVCGNLPWSRLSTKEAILRKKLSTTVEELCKGLPAPFCEFVTHVCSLDFDKKPDYPLLHSILTQCSQTEADHGGICRVAGLCTSTPRCNTSPRGSVWNRPQSQFLDPVTGPRAHYCTLGQSPLLSPFLCLTLLPCPIPLFLLYT